MKHLMSAWEEVGGRLESGYVCLFLDCDGTLAPIAETPGEASIPLKTKKALESLSRLDRLKLAIISGRSLVDIKSVVGLDDVTYVGNHGLEVEGEGIVPDWKAAEGYKKCLDDIKAKLSDAIISMPGLFVEDKGLSLCLHYRKASIDEAKIRAVLCAVTAPYEASGMVSLLYGKKVIEVRPAAGWDKGRIVNWLLARERSLVQDEDIVAVYIGDDVTDDDAFKALGEGEISVQVGSAFPSSAKYFLADTIEVFKFLTMMLEARTRR